ncbi:hypothetical protein ORI20_03940 [Mycobacterium sp. CVI_P3]|uniref:Integral membrane protein n=1 Tax=Mycobacterium pinniadriaticum TaxID=2994102 RepID=A0ABT3S8L5_9MYCO|nr:hypothetical protein [Mycobacterium pinniadriaticum]MCX2929410.1 hypothetical protein [Mycobacterium pinniadriaticum]MCX2935834.1 hypothetical protein [Mycobacterium pinniadriaticum]
MTGGGMHTEHSIVLVDSDTASTLAQVLPLLLLTLAVELRRTQRHRGLSHFRIGMFLALFGLAETVLVLSIDGSFFPFQWFDICSAVIIFGLMSLIFALSLSEPSNDNGDTHTKTSPPSSSSGRKRSV